MNNKVTLRRVAVALACGLGIPLTHGATWDWNNTSNVWSAAGAWTPDTMPLGAIDTLLRFGGTGSAPYVSTYDFAGPFLLHGLELNSSATVTETISANAGGTLSFINDGATNPVITQNGSGAFDITLGLEAQNALAFGGTGTGVVTLAGMITGPGGLAFNAGNWRLTNPANSFTGGFAVNAGAFVELAPAGALSLAVGANSLVGGNAAANVLTINGGTLKLTPAGNINFANNRPLTFGGNGGILDIRNATSGNMAGGDSDLALTLNNTIANPAIIKFNGGPNGISTNTTNNGDWASGTNTLRIESYAGTGPLRIELENGAMYQNRSATVNVPVTVRGVIGGDPTSGPNASVNANLSKTTGRMIFDVTGTHNYAQGLTLEGAMQLSAAGAARALDGNVVLAPGAYVAFNGRATGTALGAPITAAGTNTANTQHPLYIGAGGNDTLTIQPGAVAVFDSRIRHEQTNSNAVLLNARAVIRGGGELRITQSLSRATAVLAGSAGQMNTNSTSALAAHHILDGDIQGEGSTANEALFSIYLPAAGGTDSNGDQVPDTLFEDLGGVVFRSNVTGTTAGTNGTDLIINGTGFGGLRVEGRPRPNLLFNSSGAVADPVSNAAKVANLLTADRLSKVTGTGGYLTPAPLQNTFDFPAGGDWGLAVPVGLKVVDHHPGGTDVSMAALTGFNHNLLVDAGATLDLGAAAPFLIDNNAVLLGKGTVISSGSVTVNIGASIAPGLNDVGTLPITTGNLAIDGSLSIGVQGATADLLAVTGNLALNGSLAVSGTFGTQDLVIASYSGTLLGSFGTVTGLSPLFTVDYGTGTNSVIKLIYDTSPARVWEGAPGATWSVGGGNWKNGAIYSDGNRVRFDGSAAGSTTVTISGSDVKPLETVVNADTKNYTIISSAGAALAGDGALTKTGAMILTLLGPATYLGGTIINAGTIALGSDNALPDTGLITIAAGATLNTQGHTDIVGDITVDGSVTGGGTLTVNALTLSGSGTFSPNLISNGSINKTGGPGSLSAPIDFNTGVRTINVDAASTLTITSTLSNGGFDKTGPGDLVLAPVVANVHQGGTVVSEGKLIAQIGAIPVDSALTVNTGGTLEVAGAQPLVLSALSGTGGTITGANGITLNQSSTTTFAGSITGVTSVNMNGTGQITLNGTSAYSGGLFANSGRVLLMSPTAGGAGTVTLNSGGKLGSGAGLGSRVELNGGTLFGVGGPPSIASNELVATAGTTTTISLSDPDAPGTRSEMRVLGTLRGSGDLNVVISSNSPHPDGGVGFRLLGTAASDFSGTITMGQSTKFEMQTGQAGPFSPGGTAKLVFTGGDFFGGLSGNYSQFNVRSNFAGTTVFGNNVEVIGNGFVNMNMAGSGGGAAVVGSTSVLGNLRIGSQTLGVNKNGDPTQILEFTSVTLTAGDATFAPTTLNFGASGRSDLRLGPISEAVPGSGIILNGGSNLILAGVNTYTGTTRVENGTLRLAAAGALPASGALVMNGGTLDFAPGFVNLNQTIGSLSGTGGMITNTDVFSTRALDIAQDTNTEFSGSISGNLALAKTGSGELVLSGAVSPAIFTIDGGTVRARGTITARIILGNGGNLSGAGTVNAIDVAAGGLITPGEFVAPSFGGSLSATDVTFILGSAMDVSLAKLVAGAQPVVSDYASLKVSGTIDVEGAELDLSLGSGLELGDIFTIIINDGPQAVGGRFFDLPQGSLFQTQGHTFRISYFDDAGTPDIFELEGVGNDVALMVVPEPASCALLLGGLALLSTRRRRASEPVL